MLFFVNYEKKKDSMSPTHTDIHGAEIDADGNRVIGTTPHKGRSFKLGLKGVESVAPVGKTQVTPEQLENRLISDNVAPEVAKKVSEAAVRMSFNEQGVSLDKLVADYTPKGPAPSVKFDPSGNNL